MDHWISTGSGRMLAREWRPDRETGAPIILLHDSLGCVALWRDFPAELSAQTHRRVIAYDRLGFGQSDARQGRLAHDFIYSECRTSLPTILNELDIKEFVLFGHSVGGGMSVAGAADFAARCVGLISESAQIFREEQTFEGIRRAQPKLASGSPQRERLEQYHGEKTDWVVSSWIDSWLDPEFVLDLGDHMKLILCPVLALHGDLDEYGSIDQPNHLCSSVRGPAQLRILNACGHVPHRDRPGEVIGAVANFLG